MKKRKKWSDVWLKSGEFEKAILREEKPMKGQEVLNWEGAAFMKKRAEQHFGSEKEEFWEIFKKVYCKKCRFEKAEGDECFIISMAKEKNMLDAKYPNQLRYGEDGQPECTEFTEKK